MFPVGFNLRPLYLFLESVPQECKTTVVRVTGRIAIGEAKAFFHGSPICKIPLHPSKKVFFCGNVVELNHEGFNIIDEKLNGLEFVVRNGQRKKHLLIGEGGIIHVRPEALGNLNEDTTELSIAVLSTLCLRIRHKTRSISRTSFQILLLELLLAKKMVKNRKALRLIFKPS